MVNLNRIPIYICNFTNDCNKIIKSEGSLAGHVFSKKKKQIILWPEKTVSATITPKNFIELKKQFSLKELLFIDRIIGAKKPGSIINHVNRSGQNFLRGQTPTNELPQFPDMSKIYNKISELDPVTVHTVGENRFKKPLNEDVIWSETIGLIAPVAHYVGIKIFAIGSSSFEKTIKLF